MTASGGQHGFTARLQMNLAIIGLGYVRQSLAL